MRWYNRITSVEWLQIAAALTAAPRWAIAIMPLDGVRFRLSSSQWFEVASLILSLAFAVVEIGATAYMMRAWRREQHPTTRNALGLLWVVSLGLMLVAQVPPLLVNIDGTPISAQPGWLKIAWVTAGVAMTFVIIGGVGFAERTLATDKQPLADDLQTEQPTETDSASTPRVADDPEDVIAPQKTGGMRDLEVKPDESIVLVKTPLESPVLSAVKFDEYELTGDTRKDIAALLALAPLATNASLARKLNKSPERVRQLRASLAQEAQA